MTTAEIGLVTTAVVGVAAAAGPAVTSWLDRKHQRDLARAQRLFDQRRQTYNDLAKFLERQRTILDRTGYQSEFRKAIPAPPAQVSDEEWVELQGRTAVTGSIEVQERLSGYREAIGNFTLAVMEFEREDKKREGVQTLPHRWNEAQQIVTAMRKEALESIDDVERVMRDELANL